MTEKDGGKGFESAGGKLNISGSCQKQEWKLPRWPGRSSCSEKKEEKAGEIIIKRSHRTAAQSFSIRFDLVEHLLSFQCQMKLWLWGFYWVPWECCLFFLSSLFCYGRSCEPIIKFELNYYYDFLCHGHNVKETHGGSGRLQVEAVLSSFQPDGVTTHWSTERFRLRESKNLLCLAFVFYCEAFCDIWYKK